MSTEAKTVSDPVHQEGGEWYFYDETWAYRYGPYSSEKEARDKLKEYAEKFL